MTLLMETFQTLMEECANVPISFLPRTDFPAASWKPETASLPPTVSLINLFFVEEAVQPSSKSPCCCAEGSPR